MADPGKRVRVEHKGANVEQATPPAFPVARIVRVDFVSRLPGDVVVFILSARRLRCCPVSHLAQNAAHALAQSRHGHGHVLQRPAVLVVRRPVQSCYVAAGKITGPCPSLATSSAQVERQDSSEKGMSVCACLLNAADDAQLGLENPHAPAAARVAKNQGKGVAHAMFVNLPVHRLAF